MTSKQTTFPSQAKWISLGHSLFFLMRHTALLGRSILLFCITILLTYTTYQLALWLLTSATGSWFATAPLHDTLWTTLLYYGWYVGKLLFVITTRLISFYLAFLLSFTVTTPLYVMLSNATTRKQLGDTQQASTLSLHTILRDLREGIKIGAFGLLITAVALLAAFIPVIGHMGAFLLYTYYSALMFLDYPTSELGWSLGEKLSWLNRHRFFTLRLGLLPALVGLIPLLNLFLLALLFPLLTVHTTLNFNAKQKAGVPTTMA